MLKRKALWLLLASGIVLQFNCIPSTSSLLGGSGLTTLLTYLGTTFPALQTYTNAIIAALA